MEREGWDRPSHIFGGVTTEDGSHRYYFLSLSSLWCHGEVFLQTRTTMRIDRTGTSECVPAVPNAPGRENHGVDRIFERYRCVSVLYYPGGRERGGSPRRHHRFPKVT